MADLETCLKDPLVVALGEVGIDLYHDKTYLDRQEEMLKAQIQLAIQWDKPMIFHIRHSYDEVVAILDEFGESCPPGVWHCFEGTLDQAKAFVKRGWMISFSGLVTFKKNDDIRDVARWVPDEHLLIETDSPYLSPEPLRREKNEPHKVSMVADCLAKLRGISASSCADLTANNTRRLFRF
jgi:TatD DNase family protein